MSVLLVVIFDIVIRCIGFSCEQFSYITYRQLLISGLLELVIEVPLISKGVIAVLRVYKARGEKFVSGKFSNN